MSSDLQQKITDAAMRNSKLPWELIRSFVETPEEADKISKLAETNFGISITYHGCILRFSEE